MSQNAKVIVVTNRLPFHLKKGRDGKLQRDVSVGGSVIPVIPNGLWVGWAGVNYTKGQLIPESDASDNVPLHSHNVLPVIIAPEEYNGYHNGCCNSTFWPLFHSMPDRAVFSSNDWQAYGRVNKLFGEEAVKALGKTNVKVNEEPPIIWIHNYHLMLTPIMIRHLAVSEKLRCKLGFFLHVPFPTWDLLKLFPWADELLQGMLGSDTIGFQTESHCRNFVDCCWRGLGCRVNTESLLVEQGGRTVQVRPFPVGVPCAVLAGLAEGAPPADVPAGVRIVLGVDSLDYTGGVPQKLRVIEAFFNKYPLYIGKVTLFQIVVPSQTEANEDPQLREEIDSLVSKINGKYSTSSWAPVQCVYSPMSQQALAGLYKDSPVAFVTPLRDGMSLVAKEYVACQVKDPPGVLIVSTFSGAGEVMQEALVCNPYETEEAAQLLHRALTMPEDEKKLRMNFLKRREKAQDSEHWTRSCLNAVASQGNAETRLPSVIPPVSFQDFDQYLSKYLENSMKVALLLDYDGTLSPLAAHPDLATLPPQTKDVLKRLADNPNIHLCVVSGRNVNKVKQLVGVDNITYAGSHGVEIVEPNGTKFVYPMPKEYGPKATELLKKLNEQVCRDGAWVEDKGIYLTYHYRKTPEELRGELVAKAKKLIQEAGFRVELAHSAVESKPPIEWHKGRASIHILTTAYGFDWSDKVRVIYVGDDVTDEDAMRALKGMAMSFRVTQSTIVKTSADRRLPDTDSVVTLLKWVERHYAPSSGKL